MVALEKRLDKYLGRTPRIGKRVYIARGAVVVGAVSLGPRSSVWYHAVLRGDINQILVGESTNIQDHAVVHLEDDSACRIGNYVTIGHSAIVHACTVGDESLVGMGSIILDRAVIGNQCLIGANALVTQGMKIPDGALVLGVPAKVVRILTRAERQNLRKSAEKYAELADYCLRHHINVR